NEENISPLAELATALVDGVTKVNDGVVISVQHYGETYPMRGSLDARRRVGYFDAILGRTLRLALSSVVFSVKTTAVEEESGDKQTQNSFKEKDLSVFLNEHQIMILPESIVIVMDGKPETITTSHQAYDRI
ncbi:hypothetical protein ACUX4R_27075, partial [Salmonella enterica]